MSKGASNKEARDKKLKTILGEMGHIWKTESALLTYIRGGIRRSLWNRSPIKIEFINKNRYKIPSPNPKLNGRLVWGGLCALTGREFQLKDMDVDHRKGGHSLRSLDDLQAFLEGIVLVSLDDLQFVSRDAHKIKSYSEKFGVTFEEASVIKQAIEFEKKGVKQTVDFLKSNGYTPASSKDKRRLQLIEHFGKEKANAEG